MSNGSHDGVHVQQRSPPVSRKGIDSNFDCHWSIVESFFPVPLRQGLNHRNVSRHRKSAERARRDKEEIRTVYRSK